MIRRLPVVPTLVVLCAAGLMIGLGFWQIARLHQKEAMLARYGAAQHDPQPVAWPGDAESARRVYYRHSMIRCASAEDFGAVAGRNAAGTPGWAHVARCVLANGGGAARVVLGWSDNPATIGWPGGTVQGIIAPGPRLVADPPLAGLAANARPDPREIPNNHLSYAVQWFLFAATALVIYTIALRRRPG